MESGVKQPREISKPVLDARTALEILRMENAEQAAAVEKILPGYALKLEKSGAEVTVEILLEAARLGADYLRVPRVESSPVEDSLFAYERIVNGFDRYKGRSPNEQMIIACEKGDLERVKACHKQGVDITTGYNRPLPMAAGNGHLAVVEYLHKHGADLTAGGDNVALRYAAASGHLTVVEYLHKHGADITARRRAALLAAENGHLAVVEYLHKQGADFTVWNNAALRGAAKNGHLAVVEYLHKHGADVAVVSNEALKWAAVRGHLALVEYLHQHGADLTALNSEALKLAAMNGQLAVAEYLHKRGAVLRTWDNMGLKGAAMNGQLALVAFLHKHGADLTARGNEALLGAAVRGQLAVVEYLHQHGVDLTAKDNGALRGAAEGGHLAVVEYLHKHGADLTAKDNGALRGAAENGHLAVVEYLHKHGADLTKLSQERISALELLAKGRDIWQKTVRMDPPKGLHNQNPAFFKKACFEAVVKMLAKEGYWWGRQANTMAFHTAGLFQSEQRVLQYLEKWGAAGKQPLHDLVQMIKLPQDDLPNLKDWGDAVLKCGPSMARLVKFSGKIPSPVKSADGRTWSMVNTRAECAKHSFNRAAEHPELAALCFEHDVDEDDFNKALKLVKKGPSEAKTIPEIKISGEKFDMDGGKFYRLPANDIRGLFLGEATNCCQSIGSAGGPCAEHGYTSPDGGFFVVENSKGRIVAQAWAWRGEQGEMCLDSLETLGNNVTADQWRKILQETAKELTVRKDHDITALHVGTGGKTPDRALREDFKESATAKPRDYSGYRDSKGPQIVVWRR